MKEIKLSSKINDVVDFNLKSNGSTGFDWIQENVPKEVKVERNFIADEPIHEGSGGELKFSLSANTLGDYEFTLRYKRPWMENSTDDEIVEVKLRVE